MLCTIDQIQEMISLSKQNMKYPGFSRPIRDHIHMFEVIQNAFRNTHGFLFRVEEFKDGQGPKFRHVIQLNNKLHQIWSAGKLHRYLMDTETTS